MNFHDNQSFYDVNYFIDKTNNHMFICLYNDNCDKRIVILWFFFFINRDVMKKGGNAVDASIATMICDGALCPEYMGLGGGFIMSIYNATTKKVISIDARETAPAAANSTMFEKQPENSVYGLYYHT